MGSLCLFLITPFLLPLHIFIKYSWNRIISGVETENVSVMDKIIKSPRMNNWEWNYHLEPPSITFFSMATEVCDASIAHVDEHLAEVGGALLPSNRWCPWSSRVIREVHPWF
eukprot:gene9278-10881_t